MPWPLRYMPSDLPPLSQSPFSMVRPSGCSQTMSSSFSPLRTAVPVKNRLRWNVGCSRRSRMRAEVNSTSGVSTWSQCTHEISESWA